MVIRMDEYGKMRKVRKNIETLWTQERYEEALALSHLLDQMQANEWKTEIRDDLDMNQKAG